MQDDIGGSARTVHDRHLSGIGDGRRAGRSHGGPASREHMLATPHLLPCGADEVPVIIWRPRDDLLTSRCEQADQRDTGGAGDRTSSRL